MQIALLPPTLNCPGRATATPLRVSPKITGNASGGIHVGLIGGSQGEALCAPHQIRDSGVMMRERERERETAIQKYIFQ